MALPENFSLSPQQLDQLFAYLKQHYGKAAYAVIADPTAPICPTGSRLGGLPYWDFAQPYPCGQDGQPLRLLCQINLKDLPDLPFSASVVLPKTGLLQFFAAADDCFGCTYEPNNPDCKIVYQSIPDADISLTMEQLRLRIAEAGLDENIVCNLYDEAYWPVTGETALRFKAGTSLPHEGDYELFVRAITEACASLWDLKLEQDEMSDFVFDKVYDAGDFVKKSKQCFGLTEDECKLSMGELLGYPNFTQDNPLSYEEEVELKRFNTLLLMLDEVESDTCSMMWGDCGIANFFINAQALAKLDFSDVFYTWDCC